MNGFLERVDGEDAQRRLDGRIGPAGTRVLAQQTGERFEGELVEALALGRAPILERPLVDPKSGEKVALVERGCARQIFEGAPGYGGAKLRSVDRDGRRVQPDRISLDDDDLVSVGPVTARGGSVDIASTGALDFTDLDATAGNVRVVTGGDLTSAQTQATGTVTLNSGGTLFAGGPITSGGVSFWQARP